MHIGGRPATPEEQTQLNEQSWLNIHAQRLVGIAEGRGVPSNEDINTPEHFVREDEEPINEVAADDDGVDLGGDADD